jgi:hypothetical protein
MSLRCCFECTLDLESALPPRQLRDSRSRCWGQVRPGPAFVAASAQDRFRHVPEDLRCDEQVGEVLP